MNQTAYLVLDDGSIWPGKWFGAVPPTADKLENAQSAFSGELIFNTGMTGYHEILTDPSYTGQIVLFTYPHIGNYGDDDIWDEIGPMQNEGRSRHIMAGGMVVRSFYNGPVPEGRRTLDDFLKDNGICGIGDVDTRAITLRLRQEGSCNAIIIRPGSDAEAQNETFGKSLSSTDASKALDFVKNIPSMSGRNLTGEVGTGKIEVYNEKGTPHVALLDCGVKMNIIRELKSRGCRVSLLPSDSIAEDVLKLHPDALLLSNGPGDPEPLEGPTAIAEKLLGKIPLWGICLGHQILAQASGGSTYKMSFGHHGLNHPVRDEKTGRVFVTSQNHGFAVDEKSLPDNVNVRFRNANDGSIEGLENKEMKMLCVQHHPEAAPGPVDSSWVFDAFLETLGTETGKDSNSPTDKG